MSDNCFESFQATESMIFDEFFKYSKINCVYKSGVFQGSYLLIFNADNRLTSRLSSTALITSQLRMLPDHLAGLIFRASP